MSYKFIYFSLNYILSIYNRYFIKLNGNNEFLAVSIGVIEYKNELAFNEAYVFADKCLYKAKAIKNKGENTFSNFDGECDV